MRTEEQKGHSKNIIKNTDGAEVNSATQIESISVRQITPEKFFVFIAVLVGSLLVFLTPPMAVPDENTHFMNAYAVSKGDFFADVEDGQIGVWMPQVYVDFISNYNKKFTSGLEEKQNFAQYYLDSWLRQDMGKSVFYVTALRKINPVGYLVSGFGMAIGRTFINLCSADMCLPYNILLFGRIFNLMFYIIVTYYAIKITPIFKRTMLLLSLMPMSIYLAASVSYDAVIIPISFLFFAYAMKLIKAEDSYIITKKDIFLISVITIFLVGIKVAYVPFMLILFCIKRQHFGTTKRYLMIVGYVASLALLIYVLPAMVNHTDVMTQGIVVDTDQYQMLQKEFLATHKNLMLPILLNTFANLKFFYATGLFGILGNLDTNFPAPVLLCFYLILIATVLVDASEAGHFSLRLKMITAVAFIICILGMFYVMYINWTSLPNVEGVGADYVSGIQGRYFIPISLFFFLLFSNTWLKRHCSTILQKVSQKISYTVYFTTGICVLLTIMTVYLRFW